MPSNSLAKTLAARLPREHTLSGDVTLTPTTRDVASTPLPHISLTLPEAGEEMSASSDRELHVVSVLGEGGMGSVYLAKQRSLDREVAIKTVKRGAESHARALRSEAIITGSLEHPGILPVHQLALAADGRPVLVMKRVEGTSWRVLLAHPGHPAWAALRVEVAEQRAFHLEVLRRVAETLAFAHSRGIVHRDLKPENVMLGAFGEVYVVDWGIAVRAGTRSEEIVGTPRYMAPEMVVGEPVDARTDVFMLGGTLHFILTGAPPHAGDDIDSVLLAAHAAARPSYSADVDPELAELAIRAMAADPGARFADARELADALRAHARHGASRALSRGADERRSVLAARLARPIGEADIPALYALLAECRFGYAEAAREWADNAAVSRGLQACREHAVVIEIARRDPIAARAQLATIGAPDPELVQRVDALERTLASQRAETHRVRQLADAADVRASPGVRVLARLVTAIAVLMAWLWTYARIELGAAPDAGRALLFSLVALSVLVAGLASVGRGLWSQPFNRRMSLWAITTMVAIVVHRFCALIAETPVPQLLMHDLVIFGVAFATASVFAFRALALGAAIGFAGALLAAFHPAHAPVIFGVSAVSALLTIPFGAWRAARAPKGSPLDP